MTPSDPYAPDDLPVAAGAEHVEPTWMTLPEAARYSGLSVPALRKRYQRGSIRSTTVPGRHGDKRLVARADLPAAIGDPSAEATTEVSQLASGLERAEREIASLKARMAAIETITDTDISA